jgi:hypothetical protein
VFEYIMEKNHGGSAMRWDGYRMAIDAKYEVAERAVQPERSRF